jgi:hypothetical protein
MRKLVIDIQVGLIAIAAALVVAVLIAASTFTAAHHTKDTISVTGSAKNPIEADLVQWDISVSTEGPVLAGAARRLEGDVLAVRRFLITGGLAASELQLPPLQTSSYQHRLSKTRSVTVFTASQSIAIETRKIDAVDRLGRDLASLVAQGIDVQADPISYVSTQLVEARIAALSAATANAKQRAETIVKGLGAKLGRLRQANLGVYQVTPRYSTDVAGEGINDTSSRQKDVTAVVTVTFEVKH